MLKQGNLSETICSCVFLFIDAQTRCNAVIPNHVENYIVPDSSPFSFN